MRVADKSKMVNGVRMKAFLLPFNWVEANGYGMYLEEDSQVVSNNPVEGFKGWVSLPVDRDGNLLPPPPPPPRRARPSSPRPSSPRSKSPTRKQETKKPKRKSIKAIIADLLRR